MPFPITVPHLVKAVASAGGYIQRTIVSISYSLDVYTLGYINITNVDVGGASTVVIAVGY